jgi:DNA-binding CsgD family transcriptional regulator
VALHPEPPVRIATEIVGREAELRMLRGALGAQRGASGILIDGEAGIGKTAIWQAGVAAAEELGFRALSVRAASSESTLSHAGVADLLASVADEVGDGLPEPQRHALEVALLRADTRATVDPRAVGAATLAVVRAASARAPLLLAIDDMQWLDPASAGAVRFALRRLGDEPVILLATRRRASDSEDVDIGLPAERLAQIEVGPLAPEALHQVLQQQLGVPVSRPALARLGSASGGNPYYALELGRAALRETGDGRLTAELPLPEGIYAVLQDRLQALPAKTRDALGTVAAMGHPTTAALADAIEAEALDAAFAAEVLHEHGERVRFDHPLLAEAAYRLLPPARRRAVHRRLATLAGDVEERGHHLAAATTKPDATVAADIEAGAWAATARGAPAAAAALLEASARVEPVFEVGARRRIDAARLHIAAGDGTRSKTLARAVVDELPPGSLRSRALVALSDQEGPLDELTQIASQAVEEAGDDVEALVEALLTRGLYVMIAGDEVEGYECMKRALDLCDASVPLRLRIKAMTYYGELAEWRGEADGMRLLREAAKLEGDDAIPDPYRGPHTVLGRTLVFADELEEGRRLLEERYGSAVDLGDDESRAGVAFHLAELEIRAGRVDVALRYAEEAQAIHEGSYAEDAQGSITHVLSLVATFQGDADRARELGERGLARSEEQGDALFAAIHRAALGFLELSLGDNAAAVEWFGPVAEAFVEWQREPGLPHFVVMPDAVEALVGVGRLDDADRLLVAWEQAGERFDRPRVRATAARCRALVAAASVDVSLAGRCAEAAVDQSRELPLPFDLARSLMVHGNLLRRTKKKAAARAALDEALELLEAMGARLWAERARTERARISGRAPSGGLTPTEERVAQLVAEGRSNKEVADVLFVSVRTVEANLTRIYAKLGIRSRTELASRRGR